MRLDIDPLLRGGAVRRDVRGRRGGATFEASDWVAEEVPIALEYNGISHAVMLATPLDLEEFALGFSLSEGIVGSAAELYDVEREDGALGITLHLHIAAAAFARLKERRRSMAGRTGCGLCGTESLAQVSRALPRLADGVVLAGEAISRALGELQALQVLQRATGAVHAAGWCTREGELRLLREDVGRHNALDKLVGALAMSRDIDASTGFMVVTSRASFEMVQKAVSARVPLLAAVSAPTALAIDVAEKSRLTLVGFARGSNLVVYAQPQRLLLGSSPAARGEPLQGVEGSRLSS